MIKGSKLEVLVVGPAKTGKSTFAQTIARDLIERGVKVEYTSEDVNMLSPEKRFDNIRAFNAGECEVHIKEVQTNLKAKENSRIFVQDDGTMYYLVGNIAQEIFTTGIFQLWRLEQDVEGLIEDMDDLLHLIEVGADIGIEIGHFSEIRDWGYE